MRGWEKARVVIAGSGAFGAAIALACARDGADVLLADPSDLLTGASGVAAGMVAPAFETAPSAADEDFARFRAARDLWPAFAQGLDIGLSRSGALWVDLPGAEARLEGLSRAMTAAGAETELWPAARLREQAPMLNPNIAAGLFSSEDWRIEPLAALKALRDALTALGGRLLADRVLGFEHGRARLESGATVAADALVVATGFEVSTLAPELSLLTPIKGHILRYAAATTTATPMPMIRCSAGYAVQARDGLRVGATMEPGIADQRVDRRAAGPLGRLATALFPALSGAAFQLQAGVRAAAPDEWPLVGPSRQPGVWLAVGARRNGWLLAPLVARMTAAYLAGGDPGPYAEAFYPSRFATS